MSSYPSEIYSPRTKENKSGVVYNPAETTRLFAEDVVGDDDEIVAIETELGTSPKNTSASVKERLKGIRSLSDADDDVLVVSSDKIGIGINPSSYNLDVYGTLRVGTTGTITGGSTVSYLDQVLFVDGVNGRVGIGTTSPGQPLHIASNSNTALQVEATTDARAHMRLKSNGIVKVIFGYLELQDCFVLNHAEGGANLVTSGLVAQAGNIGIGVFNPTAKIDVNSNVFRLRTSKTPSSASDTGNAGDICWDSSYLYICIATNTWQRVAHSTW